MNKVKVKCRVFSTAQSFQEKSFETTVDSASIQDASRSGNKEKFSIWCKSFFPSAVKVEFVSMSKI